MPEQQGERKYEATPFRRQKAREEGRVPRSQDLASAIVLLGALLMLLLVGELVSGRLVNFMRFQLGDSGQLVADQQYASNKWWTSLVLLAQTVLPLIAITLVIALASNVFQTGLLLLPSKLSLDIKRVNPLAGLKRLVGLSNFVRLGFGLVKVVIVAVVAVVSIMTESDLLNSLGGMDVRQLLPLICRVILSISIKIGIALLILAIFDYLYQRWKLEQDLRMTEEEMREEIKTTVGDPLIRQRRQAVQKEVVKQRVEQGTKQSDVTVTNPTELAIAIRYDMETMAAPVVMAKGAGFLAQRIRRISLENNVPIVEKKELARFLYKEVEVGDEIPSSQYAAMAEVLRYVYELKGKKLPNAA